MLSCWQVHSPKDGTNAQPSDASRRVGAGSLRCVTRLSRLRHVGRRTNCPRLLSSSAEAPDADLSPPTLHRPGATSRLGPLRAPCCFQRSEPPLTSAPMGCPSYRLNPPRYSILAWPSQCALREAKLRSPIPPSCAALEKTFTINRLGLPRSPRRSLGTTNLVESPSAGIRLRTRRVTRQRNGQMILCWAADAYLETESHFRRMMGYESLWVLEDDRGTREASGGSSGIGQA